MSGKDDNTVDEGEDDNVPIDTASEKAVHLSVISPSDSNTINPGWISFLSAAQANVGIPSYNATTKTYAMATSKRFHQMNFGSRPGADAMIDDNTIMLLLDTTSSTSLKLSVIDTLNMFSSKINSFDQLMQNVINAIPSVAMLTINTTATNACWLSHNARVQLVTRLTFSFAAQFVFDGMKKALADQFGFSISTDPSRWQDIQLIATQTTVGEPKDDKATDFNISTALEFIIKIPISGFIFWISHSLDSTEITLTEDPRSTDGLFSRLSNLGGPDSDSADLSSSWHDVFPELHLWSANVVKAGQGPLVWQLRLLLVFQPEQASAHKFVVGIVYDSSMKTLNGALLFTSSFPNDSKKRLPTYDARDDSLMMFAAGSINDTYNLVDFFSATSSAPAGLPTEITEAFINVTLPDTSAKPPVPASFSLALTAVEPITPTRLTGTDDAKVPAPFEWNKINIAAARVNNEISLEIFTSFTLDPKDSSLYSPANLWVDLKKNGTAWEFHGHADNLQFGSLIRYFEEDFQDPIMGVLGKLAIPSLDIDYTFDSNRSASSFLMNGSITLGQLELTFLYQYAKSTEPNPASSKPKNKQLLNDKGINQLKVKDKGGKVQSDWLFEAVLGATADGATVGTIADSIIDDASSKLPDFVKDIEIKPASTGKGAVYLRISKSTDGPVKQAIFTMIITISTFQVTFVQISSGAGKAKQLLRASVDPLPIIKGIPLLNELPQPFDKLAYHWVRDANGTGGFTQTELDAVNGSLGLEDMVMYKPLTSKKDSGKGVVVPVATKSGPVVMAIGHHFVVIDGGKAIVDHNFSNAKTGPKTSDKQPSGGRNPLQPAKPAQPAKDDTNDPQDTTTDAAPSKGEVSKTTKLLTVDSFGLQFKDGVLWILIDATIALGPISLSLLGFGIGVPMSQLKLNKLSSLDETHLIDLLHSIKWQINGMAVAFEKPPLILAGVFEHEIVEGKESYRGGIAITFPPYVFVAVGEYSIVKKNNNEYKSIFVYAKLDGPLVQLEFGTVSGVRLGFGYNSRVRSPDVEELTDFPFISDVGAGNAGNNPKKILDSMTKPSSSGKDPWVDAQQDSYWFAVGMTITAFEVLSVTAVALLGFKDSGIVISIFADAIAQLPARDAPREASILYVELALMAELNFGDGYFKVEAALAPTSFLLVPQCQLHGGFALCTWFGKNEHAGDFVFTVGGYHPAFPKPAHYPDVRRLGLSFIIGDMISVTGEGYFAITPQVAMGGALLHISLSVGPVSAFLDASFNAMINFNPLHYVADFHVSIGVAFDADILFIHVHIECSVGADLHIEGPEFGGKAHVDFYLFAFDIYFGDTNHIPDPITLQAFYDMVHKAGPEQGVEAQSNPSSLKYSDPEMNRIQFALEDGAFTMPQRDSKHTTTTDVDQPKSDPAPNSGANSIWNVKGGTFQFRVSCDFAISEACIDYTPHPDPAQPSDPSTLDKRQVVPLPDPDKALRPIWAKPMQLGSSNGDRSISSVLTVTILNHDGNAVPNFQVQYLRKPMPTAVWGEYSSRQDPNRKADVRDVCASDHTVELAMGLVIHSPPPRLERAKMPAFNATAMAKLEVPMGVHRNDKGEQIVDHWILPDMEPEQLEGMPLLLPKGEADRPSEDRWHDMQETWNDAYFKELVDGQDGILNVFGSALGWSEALVGGVPEILVGHEKDKGLAEYYLGLPRVSEGVDSAVGDSSS